MFVLHLPGKDKRTLNILCTVAYCRRREGEAFTIGAEFTCMLDARLPSVEEESKRVANSILGASS